MHRLPGMLRCLQRRKIKLLQESSGIRSIGAENLQDRIINYFRVSCQHCDNPACLPVCPAKAIYKGPHGEVLVDQSKCISCGACAMGLPVRCSEVQQKRQDILLGWPGLGFRSASAASAAHSRQSRKMHALRPAHLQRSST